MSDVFDRNNIPRGDGLPAGIHNGDDDWMARSKHAAYQQQQDEHNSRTAQSSGLSTPSYRPTRLVAHPDNLLHWYCSDTQHLASIIESKRLDLEKEGINPKPVVRLARNALRVILIFMLVSLFVQFSWSLMASTIVVGLLLIRTESFCKKSYTKEELDATIVCKSYLRALAKNYEYKKQKAAYSNNYTVLRNKYEAPHLKLTLEFIKDFNRLYKEQTGKNLPYVFYRKKFDGNYIVVSAGTNIGSKGESSGELVNW